MKKDDTNKGFSLIELLGTIVVFGFVAAAGYDNCNVTFTYSSGCSDAAMPICTSTDQWTCYREPVAGKCK